MMDSAKERIIASTSNMMLLSAIVPNFMSEDSNPNREVSCEKKYEPKRRLLHNEIITL